jgi:hypothetical protein
MLRIAKALGTQFNSESSQTMLLIDRLPHGAELRRLMKHSKLVIKRRRKTEEVSLFWYSNIKVSWHIDYFVVHYLKDGRFLSYSKREHNVPMSFETMESLYLESLEVVRTQLKSEGVWSSLGS